VAGEYVERPAYVKLSATHKKRAPV